MLKSIPVLLGVLLPLLAMAADVDRVLEDGPRTEPAPDAESVVIDLNENEAITLSRVPDSQVRIDGVLDEPVWANLPAYDEFVVIEPDTLVDTSHATRVRVFYDETGLYFGVDMDQPPETLIARLSGRDNRGLNRDSINITLDTSGEGRYGYWFGLNLGGSLSDGTLLPERQFSNEWDGAWRGASHETPNGWSGEFHIPWGSVAMPSAYGTRRIGLYMSRKVAYVDERWGWPALPSTVPVFISALQSLSVEGVNPKQEYSIYPFAAVTQDRIDNEVEYRAGADFFWRPSPNFQMTATINPDFGAVESDDVDINLTATETFFPEKRLFFLEGNEIFQATPRADPPRGGVGFTGAPTTMINTRRIGGQPLEPVTDPDVELSERDLIRPVDLIGALKVTGQSGGFRYGMLAAFEDDVKFDATRDGDPFHLEGESSDYGVARVLYEDAPGGAYRSFGVLSTAVINDQRQAMTHGVDGHYLSEDGKWKVDGQMYMSDIQDEETGYAGFVDLEYTPRQGLSQRFGIQYEDEHVDINDLGFQERNDRFRIRSSHTRRSSDISWARDNEFDVRGFIQRNKDGLFTGAGVFFADRMTFDNLSQLTLRASFQPERYDDLNSFGNGAYRLEEKRFAGLGWDSDTTKPLSIEIGAGFSEEGLGGDTWIGRVELNWRPSDRFSLSTSVRHVDRDGWLLHQEDRNFTTFDTEQWEIELSSDYFLSARQQFRASMQWVGIRAAEDEFYLVPNEPGDLIPVTKPPGPDDSFTISDMTLQVRYRWEIAPLSDLFVVYTRIVDDSGPLKSFSDVFSDGYDNPIGDFFVVKLRYRFGS